MSESFCETPFPPALGFWYDADSPQRRAMAKQLRRDIRALLLAPSSDLAVQVDDRLRKLGFPALRPAQTQLLTLVEETKLTPEQIQRFRDILDRKEG